MKRLVRGVKYATIRSGFIGVVAILLGGHCEWYRVCLAQDEDPCAVVLQRTIDNSSSSSEYHRALKAFSSASIESVLQEAVKQKWGAHGGLDIFGLRLGGLYDEETLRKTHATLKSLYTSYESEEITAIELVMRSYSFVPQYSTDAWLECMKLVYAPRFFHVRTAGNEMENGKCHIDVTLTYDPRGYPLMPPTDVKAVFSSQAMKEVVAPGGTALSKQLEEWDDQDKAGSTATATFEMVPNHTGWLTITSREWSPQEFMISAAECTATVKRLRFTAEFGPSAGSADGPQAWGTLSVRLVFTDDEEDIWVICPGPSVVVPSDLVDDYSLPGMRTLDDIEETWVVMGGSTSPDDCLELQNVQVEYATSTGGGAIWRLLADSGAEIIKLSKVPPGNCQAKKEVRLYNRRVKSVLAKPR